MRVDYKSKMLQRICEDADKATRAYGEEMAEKIHLRIDQISAADSVETLVQFKIGRCHPLHGDRRGQFAMDLVHPHRLILKKVDDQTIAVKIVDITDYH